MSPTARLRAATLALVLALPSTALAAPTRAVARAPSSAPVVYAANFGNDSVTAYGSTAVGNSAPVLTLGGPASQLHGPRGLAVDGSGRLYLTNLTDTVTVYAPGARGNAAPVRVIAGAATGLRAPSGLALDGHGRLYVANNGANTITGYPAGADGNAAPIRVIGGPATGLSGPVGLVVVRSRLYVTNQSTARSACSTRRPAVMRCRWRSWPVRPPCCRTRRAWRSMRPATSWRRARSPTRAGPMP
jgi:hypothetical protein